MAVAPITPSSTLADAYAKLRPLLFHALSALAQRGFPAPPDEGLDLVHDFFLEEWGNVLRTFDPTKAKIETYAYAAFLRFARPRIVRLNRLRDGLLSPVDLTILEAQELQEPAEQEVKADLAVIGEGLARLPDLERRVLLAYMSDPDATERSLAEQFTISRYRLRLCIADGLGQLAAHLGDAGVLGEATRRILTSMWREGRTIKETARALHIKIEDVQLMRKQFFQLASASLHGIADGSSVFRSGTADFLKDLLAVLQGKTDPTTIAAIHSNRYAIVEFLNQPTGMKLLEEHAATMRDEDLAQLYEALSEPLVMSTDDQQMVDALLHAREAEAAQVGEAFDTALLPNLRRELTLFADRVFLGAPLVEEARYMVLLKDPSVVCGGEKARELARFGVTPVIIASSAKAVANLGRRFCRHHKIEKTGSFVLDKVGKTTGYSTSLVLERATAVEEVRLVCDLPEPTSERLFDWLCRVAEYSSLIFDGFDAGLWGDELRLCRTDRRVANLYERWFTPPARSKAA